MLAYEQESADPHGHENEHHQERADSHAAPTPVLGRHER